MTRMSSIYEWHDRALALPGAPDIWLKAQMGDGLVTVDTDEGLYGIASDGTWWEPTGRSDKPWLLAVDHPATAGCLLALLGNPEVIDELADHLRRDECYADVVIDAVMSGKPGRISRACIAAAAALGRWPGVGGEHLDFRRRAWRREGAPLPAVSHPWDHRSRCSAHHLLGRRPHRPGAGLQAGHRHLHQARGEEPAREPRTVAPRVGRHGQGELKDSPVFCDGR